VLELSLTEVVNREVFRDRKGIESKISNVSLAVFGVRKERNGLGLFSCKAGSRTAWSIKRKQY